MLTTLTSFGRPLALLVIVTLSGLAGSRAAPGATARTSPLGPRAAPSAGIAPFFVARGGALAGTYTVYGRSARVDFDAMGFTVEQTAPRASSAATDPRRGDGLRFRLGDDGQTLVGLAPRPAPDRVTTRFTFQGGQRAEPRPSGPLATRFHKLRGSREGWELDRPTYSGLTYAALWPGVDLTVRAGAAGLVLELGIDEGADAAAVGIVADGRAWAGPSAASRLGPIGRWAAPSPTEGRASTQAIGLVYAGQWGLPGDDRGLGIAVDTDGAAYFTGEAMDADEDIDAYVVKVNPSGQSLDYVTILGGDSYDAGYDIDVDGAGNAYVGGATVSTEASLPVLLGPDLTFNGGADDLDALVGKLDAEGKPVYLGYVGGDLVDFAEGIKADDEGHVYLEGVVQSSQATFPVAVGPDLTFNGSTDAFIVKLRPVPDDPDPAANLVYGGFIGGGDHDIGVFDIPGSTAVFVTAGHVTIDTAGAAYVSGMTKSKASTFPDGNGFGTLTSPDRSQGGDWDAWVAKVEPGGAALAYAGFAGGTMEDVADGIGVDAEGAAYFSGSASSDEATFRPLVGPDLTYNGNTDAIAAKVAPDGSAFVYLGYIGGSGVDAGSGATVTAEGELIVAGYSDSHEDTLPVVGGPDLTQNDTEAGEGDALMFRLRAVPDAADPIANLVFCGYVGGADVEQAFWVDLGPDGGIHAVGDTTSSRETFPDGDGPGAIPGAWPERGGGAEAFVVKLLDPAAPRPSATPREEPSATPPDPTASPTATRATPTPVGPVIFLPWAERG